MVNVKLLITAQMENVAKLEPMAGINDPSFSFYFKLKCESCGEVTEKSTCVCMKDQVQIPNTRGVANVVQTCKSCARVGSIKLVPVPRRVTSPLTDIDGAIEMYVLFMGFEFRGLEPFEYIFKGPLWKVESSSGTIFEYADLSSGEWIDYDGQGNMVVAISNVKTKLVTSSMKAQPRKLQCICGKFFPSVKGLELHLCSIHDNMYVLCKKSNCFTVYAVREKEIHQDAFHHKGKSSRAAFEDVELPRCN